MVRQVRVRTTIVAATVLAVSVPGLALAVSKANDAADPPEGSAAPLYALPAHPAYPQPCPPPPLPHHKHHGGPHKPHKPHGPKVPDAKLPEAPALRPHHPDLSPIRGKGMWMTTWADSKVDVPAVVAAAKAGGLRQLWVRTGGTKQGWYGRPLLDKLLPAAHDAGIAVVAWDFPSLSDPIADAVRADAALLNTFGGERLDAFSPDIETRAEGTYNSAERVALYLAHVRLAAGNRPVVATVMRPTPSQLKDYPYQTEARYVDAFAPMDYWSCHEPGETAVDSIRALAAMRPVHPVGQAYDMKWEGGRWGKPTPQEVWRFVDASRRAGAIGASLYDAETATDEERHAMNAYPWSKVDQDRVEATTLSEPDPASTAPAEPGPQPVAGPTPSAAPTATSAPTANSAPTPATPAAPVSPSPGPQADG
jgi:hypothetical protein